jgi:hypothetical protein
MTIQKSGFLKKCGYLGILASVLLIMSLVVAGCTQTASDNSGQSTAAVSPTGTSGSSAPAQGTGVSPTGTYAQGQHSGGNFLNNQTRIAAAAQTLGVSVSELQAALVPPSQGHFNLTNVAAELSADTGTTITPAQIITALGMNTGGMRNVSGQGYGHNASMNGGTPPSGQ